jgi:hypothetical protein
MPECTDGLVVGGQQFCSCREAAVGTMPNNTQCTEYACCARFTSSSTPTTHTCECHEDWADNCDMKLSELTGGDINSCVARVASCP